MITTIVGSVQRSRADTGPLIHKYASGTCAVKGCGVKKALLNSVFSGKLLCSLHREKEVEAYAPKRVKAFFYRQKDGKEFKVSVGPAVAVSQAMLAVDLTNYARIVKADRWVRDPMYSVCGGYYEAENGMKFYLKWE